MVQDTKRDTLRKFARLEITPLELAKLTNVRWSFPAANETVITGFEGICPPIELAIGDIVQALDEYLHGAISAQDLTMWALLLLGDDSFEFDTKNEESIAQVIHELAAPELHHPITPATVKEVRARLERMACRC